MAISRNPYFPDVRNGRLELAALARFHERAVLGTQRHASIEEHSYFNPFGKELDVQMQKIPPDLAVSDPEIIAEYGRIKKDFEARSASLSKNEKAVLACECHGKIMEILREHGKRNLPGFEHADAFISKGPRAFMADFIARTGFSVSEVLDACLERKIAEIEASVIGDKEGARRVVADEVGKLKRAFAGVAFSPSGEERLDPHFTFAPENRAGDLSQAAELYEKPMTFGRKDETGHLASTFPLEDDPLRLSAPYSRMVGVMFATPEELAHAARGEFGFEASRFRRQFASDVMQKISDLPEGIRDRIRSDIYGHDDGRREAFRDKILSMLPEGSFVMTGTSWPSAEDAKKAYAEYAGGMPDKFETLCKALTLSGYSLQDGAEVSRVSADVPAEKDPFENVSNGDSARTPVFHEPAVQRQDAGTVQAPGGRGV